MSRAVRNHAAITVPAPARRRGPLRDVFASVYVAFLKSLQRGTEARALRQSRWMSGLMGRAGRKLRARNLALLFANDCSEAPRVDEVERRYLDYLSRMRVDIARMGVQTLAQIHQRAEVRGAQHVAAAVAEDKGVLVVSGHSGTWWHAPAMVAALGYPASAVVFPGLPKPVVKYMNSLARQFEGDLAFVGLGAYEAARQAFKQRAVFFLAFDFTVRPEHSIWLPFGPRAALAVDTGPGIMATRHRVPVVWVNTHHDAAGRSCLEFLPAFHAGRGTDLPIPEAVLGRLLTLLYAQVAEHPEQWWLLSHALLQDAGTVLPTVEPRKLER